MSRRSSQKESPGVYTVGSRQQQWKRERNIRYQPTPGGKNLDVHGVLFAVVTVVFVVYPLMQWTLGR